MKMDMNSEIIKLKKERNLFKKRQVSCHVCDHRISRIFDIFEKKSELFAVLGDSEKMDFCLFYLEKFINASPTFERERLETEYEPTENYIARRAQEKNN